MEFFIQGEEDENNFINYLKIVFLVLFIVAIIKIKNNEFGSIKQEQSSPFIYEDKNEEIIKNNMTIKERKEKEKNDYKEFKNLKDKPKNLHDPLIKEERKAILKKFSENIGDKVKQGLNVYLDMKFNFGNQLLVLNKLIFYCEIIGCKKIILEKNNNIYIKNTIYDKNYNLTIEVSDQEYDNNIWNNLNFNFDNNEFNEGNDNNQINNVQIKQNINTEEKKDFLLLTSLDSYFYYNTYNLRLENRYNIFKKEILRNLPKIKTNKNDLYIHIRGSDIFQNQNPDFAPDYAQPPLCFYQKVIESKNFSNIYIISVDRENPVIDELLRKYKKIVFKLNSLEKDIASLAYGYNIVGSISSFLISIIKLNDNLKYFWEYDRYPTSLGFPHIHHSLYHYKRSYTIFKMKPSTIYKNEMIIWKDSKDQLKIMLNDTCPYNFTIVKPNA